MLTRLIGGNRVITLGTAIEQHFLVTQTGDGFYNRCDLIIAMFIVMLLTGEKKRRSLINEKFKWSYLYLGIVFYSYMHRSSI